MSQRSKARIRKQVLPAVILDFPPNVQTWDESMRQIAHMLPRLTTVEIMEVVTFVKVRASYRDYACDVRQCFHCNKSYRGPAVYCSLACAAVDR